MMTNKKLSSIRKDLDRAIEKTGQDPVAWLESQILAAKANDVAETDILESLKRVLKPKRPRKSLRSK